MANTEWRLEPRVGRETDPINHSFLVCARAREFTDQSHGPHELKYCECIVNYAVIGSIPLETMDDLTAFGGEQAANAYRSLVEAKLLELLSGDQRRKYRRHELEDAVRVNCTELAELVPLPF